MYILVADDGDYGYNVEFAELESDLMQQLDANKSYYMRNFSRIHIAKLEKTYHIESNPRLVPQEIK